MDLSSANASLQEIAMEMRELNENLADLVKLLSHAITQAPDVGQGCLNVEIFGNPVVEIPGVVDIRNLDQK